MQTTSMSLGPVATKIVQHNLKYFWTMQWWANLPKTLQIVMCPHRLITFMTHKPGYVNFTILHRSDRSTCKYESELVFCLCKAKQQIQLKVGPYNYSYFPSLRVFTSLLKWVSKVAFALLPRIRKFVTHFPSSYLTVLFLGDWLLKNQVLWTDQTCANVCSLHIQNFGRSLFF